MGKIFGSLLVQFQDFFAGLGPTKRMSIIAASVIAMVALVFGMFMVSGKDFVPLFTNIPTDQVSLIVSKLTEKNVPFRLEAGGQTITIPKEVLHATQMALMAEIGSDKMGTVGLEIFAKQDFGSNSHAQKVNYQRAIQGELMRAINTLSSVRQSKVILSIPSKKNFLEDSEKPTGSVVVELHPNKILSGEQVRGIQYLVASAVPGLEPGKVAILDERGKLISRDSDGVSGATDELLETKRKVETEFEGRIEQMLARVVGQTRVVAKVDATLNNRVVHSVEESVDPEKTAIRGQTSEEETLDGSRTNPAGIPGSRANLPGAENAGQVGFNQNVKKEIKTTNFEVPKTVRNIKEGAGGLERLSVAVLVDGVRETVNKEDGTTEEKWTPRSAEDLQRYENIVKSAIGFNVARGDSVKIESIRFIPEDFSEADRLLTSLERRNLLHALLKWSLLGFGLALFFFVVIRPFMQWVTDSFQESVEDMLPRTIEELEQLQTSDSGLPGMSSALPILEESIDPDKAESELLRDRITVIMEQDEEKVANAFGMWLVRKES